MKTCFLLLFALFVTYVKCEQGELLSVVAIFRHGDRTPIYMYKNDRYNSSYWPIGLGQLTNKGKEQLHDLGKWFRNRYGDFVSETFNSNDVYVRSANATRCIQSAQNLLRGLYPAMNGTDDIPIEVHNKYKDSVVSLEALITCPKFILSLLDLDKSLRRIYLKNIDLYFSLTRHSGNMILVPQLVNMLYDTLYVEKSSNLTLPKWAERKYERMHKIADQVFPEAAWTPKRQKYSVGPFLSELIGRFNARLDSANTTAKFNLYAAHDYNIANLLQTFGAYERRPPYAASLIFELRKLSNSGVYVDVYYKNGENVDSITVKGCKERCTFDDFIRALKDITLSKEHLKEECF